MDIEKIRKAIKDGRINITEHADEELENDEISNQEPICFYFQWGDN